MSELSEFDKLVNLVKVATGSLDVAMEEVGLRLAPLPIPDQELADAIRLCNLTDGTYAILAQVRPEEQVAKGFPGDGGIAVGCVHLISDRELAGFIMCMKTQPEDTYQLLTSPHEVDGKLHQVVRDVADTPDGIRTQLILCRLKRVRNDPTTTLTVAMSSTRRAWVLRLPR